MLWLSFLIVLLTWSHHTRTQIGTMNGLESYLKELTRKNRHQNPNRTIRKRSRKDWCPNPNRTTGKHCAGQLSGKLSTEKRYGKLENDSQKWDPEVFIGKRTVLTPTERQNTVGSVAHRSRDRSTRIPRRATGSTEGGKGPKELWQCLTSHFTFFELALALRSSLALLVSFLFYLHCAEALPKFWPLDLCHVIVHR